MANSFYMGVVGYYLYNSYYNMVRHDARLPWRQEGNLNRLQHDKEWAWSTYEISRWTQLSEVLILAYGGNWFLWILNRSMDDQAGRLHEAYFRLSQVNHYFTPGALIILLARVYNAYNRTLIFDIADDNAACSASDCLASNYFYDKTKLPDSNFSANPHRSFRVLEDTYMMQMALVALSVGMSVYSQANTYGSVKMHYNAAMLEKELMEEQMMEEDVEEAEEGMPAEDQFF